MNHMMRMRGLLCVLAIAGMSGVTSAQQTDPKMPDASKIKDAAKDAMKAAQPETKDAPAMDPKQMAEMQKAWDEANKLGAEHMDMKKSVGTWNCIVKMTMPGMDSSEEKASMVIEPLFDGRYQKGHFKGTFMGQAFDGFMLSGFNKPTGEYESIWVDSSSTGIMMSKGKMEGKTLVMRGEFVDPMSKQMVKQREVTRWVSDDQFLMEFYHTMNGEETLVMSMTYNRVKGDKPAEKPGAGIDAMKKAKEEAERKAKEEAEKLKNKIPGR